MELLERLKRYASDNGNDIAYINGESHDSISFLDLDIMSDRLASYIQNQYGSDGCPIVVYGHKHKYMLVSFLACVKSGHPYCPVDSSMPINRTQDIIDVSGAVLMIKTEAIDVCVSHSIEFSEIESIVSTPCDVCNLVYPSEADVYYIIFTSGSTGKPKGVQITVGGLDNFLKWSSTLGGEKYLSKKRVFVNQAPFSFDLSVMDLYTSLFTGGTLVSLDKSIQGDSNRVIEVLGDFRANVWVSTPSFINLCFINKEFAADRLPSIKLFLFCGETLSPSTAKEIRRRFPESVIVNTYGPTESTVAVTQVVINESILSNYQSLPIGFEKPGSPIFIVDPNSNRVIDTELEKGEIVITGDSLAKGYLNLPDNDKFRTLDDGDMHVNAYFTGDEGYREDGMLFYSGRMDFQIKLHGYRIELGDIENHINECTGVISCAVLPIIKKDQITGLSAYVCTRNQIEDEFEYSQQIRREIAKSLPAYMIPKKYVFLQEMPMNKNGKIDRKKLQEID